MNKHDLIVLLKRVITCNQFWYSKDRQILLGHILQKYWSVSEPVNVLNNGVEIKVGDLT